MLIEFCKSKIAHAKVTDAHLRYEGSITIDAKLLKTVGIVTGEKVHVLNLNNWQRFETYAIPGKPGKGEICLNGPAARLGLIGDEVTILSYALMSPEEAVRSKTKVIHLDSKNRIKSK